MLLGNVVEIRIATSDNVGLGECFTPIKAYVNSAGYDLQAGEDFDILPWSRAPLNTKIRMSIPKGYYGEICGRSGLAIRDGVVTVNGIIDSGYLGFIYVILFNLSDKEYCVKKGNRIAQIIFKKCENVSFSFGPLIYNTERGVKGLGSSGV